MSLAKDMKRTGASLSSEEKLMASFIRYEQFFKKYKYILLLGVIFIIGVIGYNYVDETLKQNSLKKANEAFLVLQTQPDNAEALQQLKDNNQKLYQLYTLHKKLNAKDFDHSQNYTATAQTSDISSYHKSLQNDSLGNYDGMYNDLANLIKGYHLLKSGDIKNARNALSKIPSDSQLSANVQILMHYVQSGE